MANVCRLFIIIGKLNRPEIYENLEHDWIFLPINRKCRLLINYALFAEHFSISYNWIVLLKMRINIWITMLKWKLKNFVMHENTIYFLLENLLVCKILWFPATFGVCFGERAFEMFIFGELQGSYLVYVILRSSLLKSKLWNYDTTADLLIISQFVYVGG